jgi:hypothetical protein
MADELTILDVREGKNSPAIDLELDWNGARQVVHFASREDLIEFAKRPERIISIDDVLPLIVAKLLVDDPKLTDVAKLVGEKCSLAAAEPKVTTEAKAEP